MGLVGMSLRMQGGRVITIYTDGSCQQNPGPGGWACIVETDDQAPVQLFGCDPETTNNRMEIMAAIAGLRSLGPERQRAVVLSDSTYVCDGAAWIRNWKRKGWVTFKKTPVKSKDLWLELDALLQRHCVEFKWLKGHAGDPLNELCDQLASRAARMQIAA